MESHQPIPRYTSTDGELTPFERKRSVFWWSPNPSLDPLLSPVQTPLPRGSLPAAEAGACSLNFVSGTELPAGPQPAAPSDRTAHRQAFAWPPLSCPPHLCFTVASVERPSLATKDGTSHTILLVLHGLSSEFPSLPDAEFVWVFCKPPQQDICSSRAGILSALFPVSPHF